MTVEYFAQGVNGRIQVDVSYYTSNIVLKGFCGVYNYILVEKRFYLDLDDPAKTRWLFMYLTDGNNKGWLDRQEVFANSDIPGWDNPTATVLSSGTAYPSTSGQPPRPNFSIAPTLDLPQAGEIVDDGVNYIHSVTSAKGFRLKDPEHPCSSSSVSVTPRFILKTEEKAEEELGEGCYLQTETICTELRFNVFTSPGSPLDIDNLTRKSDNIRAVIEPDFLLIVLEKREFIYYVIGVSERVSEEILGRFDNVNTCGLPSYSWKLLEDDEECDAKCPEGTTCELDCGDHLCCYDESGQLLERVNK